MLLQKTAKVQEMKTNVTVNIPREQREALGITGGDTVLLSADTEKQIIILKDDRNGRYTVDAGNGNFYENLSLEELQEVIKNEVEG